MIDMAVKKHIMNGEVTKGNGSWLQNLLLSIATTGIIACIAFLWNVNATLVKIEQENLDMSRIIDELKIRTNNMQLDMRDVRERLIKMEALTQKR